MRIKVYKGIGTDGTDVVYCNNQCRDDFGDIRFTDDDGATLIPYFMSWLVSGVSAYFDIKIPDIPVAPGTKTIYMYFDKSDETTTSSISDTFPLLSDDCESLTGWTYSENDPNGTTTGGQSQEWKTSSTYSIGVWRSAEMTYAGTWGRETKSFDMTGVALLLIDAKAVRESFHEVTFSVSDVGSWTLDGEYDSFTVDVSGATGAKDVYIQLKDLQDNYGIFSPRALIDSIRGREALASPEPQFQVWSSTYTAFSEGYGVTDEAMPYYHFSQTNYTPLTNVRKENKIDVATFTFPSGETSEIQILGESAGTLSLSGYILSTSDDPTAREMKKTELLHALRLGIPIIITIPGEGTFRVVFTSIVFEDVEGEPDSYKFTINAVEVS